MIPNGAHVCANGIRQHYLHFPGTGPSVVIVPGIVSPAMLWHHVGQWLCSTHECFVLDVRGRGLSESGPHLDYGVDACAADLLAFVDAMKRGPTIVLGHSMGARIALRAAANFSAGICALVLIDPPTSGPGRAMYPIPKSRTLELLRAARRAEAFVSPSGNDSAIWPETLRRVRMEWLPTCDERAVHAAYDDFQAQDIFKDLARVNIPVSLIAAGNGGVVSESDEIEMQCIQPNMPCIRLGGVGHQMQAENFDLFTQALRRVL